jgi:GTP pyrophosphokinase
MKDLDGLLAAVGEGTLGLQTALRRLLPATLKPAPTEPNFVKKTTGRMQVIGAPELPCLPAPCCDPEPPQSLIGYITRGNGVTVHRADCPNLPDEPDRLLSCQWEVRSEGDLLMPVILEVVCHSRMGMIHDLTGLILKRQINIVKITTGNQGGSEDLATLQFTIEVSDMFVLNGLVQELHGASGVVSIRPIVNGVDVSPAVE